MRVAIVHDDLVQWGGAERVLEGICEIYPDAPIFTSVFDKSNKELLKRFGRRKIITSFLQKIPIWKTFYKILLPLYPVAFEQFDFSDFDLVISHTTRFAKSIITKPMTKHICYCHTPPRFLWHFSKEKFGAGEVFLSYQRIYDNISSKRVDYFLAGSRNSQKRIKKIYGQKAQVVYPFIDFERFKDIETFDGGYFVVISRLNKYKKVDIAIEACSRIGIPLKVIGTGPELESLKWISSGNIDFLQDLDDEIVVRILAGCKGLLLPGVEDFGIVSLEAQALGKGVIAYKNGGVQETVIEGKTGYFFDEQTVDSLVDILKKNNLDHIKVEDCIVNAKRFNKVNFYKTFQQTIDSLVYT